MSKIIDALENEQLKENLPAFNVGDTIKVFVKVIEGKKERIQSFEGTVLKIQNGGLNTTFTVRKIVSSIGVEKTFALHSPKITQIEVLRQGKVRKSKLFYLRSRLGSKTSKIKAKDPRLS
ncbi:MAG: 50S ribosomal protein L19 [Candidatus Margulisbacteria bacterium GWF2_35_9]|nr:MAG: 50S ribosomal protein L19 [Candidatus Margulisbacteria bacterium GWF2_35_9]